MTQPVHKLNQAQQEAVHYLDGPCLVLAGAGSGKTRVITQKIAYLLNTCGYKAKKVISLTFTNKAAQEMAERLKPLVERSLLKGLTICTFHALGVRFLREEAANAGLKSQFSILDATDGGRILQELLSTTDKGYIKYVQQTISLWKNRLILPPDAEKMAKTKDDMEAARIYRSYEATLRAYQSVDFDDLILLPVQLMRNNEEVRERWQHRFTYVLVDEYQDTNECQYEWLKLLTEFRQMFTAVGDDDQAIYAWRGATIENLARLPKDYPKLKLIKLEQNYRSVNTILKAANRVISNNPNLYAKTLWSELGEGNPIEVIAMEDEQAEAHGVAMRISAQHYRLNCRWEDFAVLYRSNHQARLLEQAFRDLRIPYVLTGGQSFFDKAEIRDILAYLRVLANDQDDPAFIRAITTPKRGVGHGSLKTLGEHASARQLSLYEAAVDAEIASKIPAKQLKHISGFTQALETLRGQGGEAAAYQDLLSLASRETKDAATLLDDLMAYIGYEEHLYSIHDERAALSKWQNVQELINWLKQKGAENQMSLSDLVQHIALITRLERQEEDDHPDAVHLTTIHAAKGLEYNYVYLVGAEEGLLPHMGRDEEYGDPDQEDDNRLARIEEERRLMYVAITRARRHLTVTWSRKRKKNREMLIREPSRFIKEMSLRQGAEETTDQWQGMSVKERIALIKAMAKKS